VRLQFFSPIPLCSPRQRALGTYILLSACTNTRVRMYTSISVERTTSMRARIFVNLHLECSLDHLSVCCCPVVIRSVQCIQQSSRVSSCVPTQSFLTPDRLLSIDSDFFVWTLPLCFRSSLRKSSSPSYRIFRRDRVSLMILGVNSTLDALLANPGLSTDPGNPGNDATVLRVVTLGACDP
jgi:hypothetical protein